MMRFVWQKTWDATAGPRGSSVRREQSLSRSAILLRAWAALCGTERQLRVLLPEFIVSYVWRVLLPHFLHRAVDDDYSAVHDDSSALYGCRADEHRAVAGLAGHADIRAGKSLFSVICLHVT
eukprot:3886882-Rhodomonas_salina.2